MMRKLLIALSALLAFTTLALAQGSPGSGFNVIASGTYFGPVVPGSATTRPSNTTAYAANQIVCPTTGCAPFTINITGGVTTKFFANRVGLLKSGSGTTNASFTIWFFDNLPTLPATDQSAYTGPFAADMPFYLGNAACASTAANATSDSSAQVWYECTLSNPNTAGAMLFQAAPTGTTLYGLISATAAYTPASGEKFTPYLTGFY